MLTLTTLIGAEVVNVYIGPGHNMEWLICIMLTLPTLAAKCESTQGFAERCQSHNPTSAPTTTAICAV